MQKKKTRAHLKMQIKEIVRKLVGSHQDKKKKRGQSTISNRDWRNEGGRWINEQYIGEKNTHLSIDREKEGRKANEPEVKVTHRIAGGEAENWKTNKIQTCLKLCEINERN